MEKYVDMSSQEFRKYGYKMVDWIASYLENIEDYPALAQINPGEVKNKFPLTPPQNPQPFEELFGEIDKKVMPGMTHWNHPGFMAYFNSSSAGPGILAEFLSAAFNINGMLWKSSPASTELEEVTMNWFRQMVGLPEDFWGIIYDGASASTMHGIIAAREQANKFNLRHKGLGGWDNSPRFKIYASEFAHNSVDKAVITLGFGLESLTKIGMDEQFRMNVEELKACIAKDKAEGKIPMCIVATIGTTSVTSIDPIEEIAEICQKENIWLHVDAAHGGNSAVVPEKRHLTKGWELADSIVINPQKWMFMPIDISIFLTRKRDVLRRGISLSAEYLKTDQDEEVKNQMDYSLQLGRKFRSLKVWFTIHYYGVEGIQNIIRNHFKLAEEFKNLLLSNKSFELVAPLTFSTICFRAKPDGIEEKNLNEFNKKLMDAVNKTGKIFVSHTVADGKFTIRAVISGLRTNSDTIKTAVELFNNKLNELLGKKV